jgi:DGQHR domain-containing protein
VTRARPTPTRGHTNNGQRVLRLPALEIQQGPKRRLYTFAVDGKQVPRFAAVARVRRDEQTRLHGYQRPEALNHVGAIRRYIDSDPNPMLPNAVVIAFDGRVRFAPTKQASGEPDYVRHGVLVIPICDDGDDKPGFIVDGQQRCAAIRDAEVDNFPICVSAFITDEHADQRSQFILVNNTKALPKGLIHELLPQTVGALPLQLMARHLPARLLEQLNFEERSPMHLMIQTPTNHHGVIKDNSILRMLENSLSDGALYRFRGGESAGDNVGCMMTMLCNFWAAVQQTFPQAWNKTPRKSRLMHGAGIVSMGFLMDAIAEARTTADEIPESEEFAADLTLIADDCHWTGGEWTLGDGTARAWNDLQNTPRDIQRLSEFVLARYRAGITAQTSRAGSSKGRTRRR